LLSALLGLFSNPARQPLTTCNHQPDRPLRPNI